VASEDIRALIEEKHVHATNKDYFAILGVSMDASRAQIQKAYFELARQVHPDRLRKQKLEDLVDQSTMVFKVLSDAYNLLINPEQRVAYVEQMGLHVAATGQAMGDESDLAEMAKIFHHKGMLLLKRKNYVHAEEFFRKAYEADAESAVYALRLGWSVLNNEERDEKERKREARLLLTEAVEKDEKNAEAHYHLALFYKQTENVKLCKEHLQQAIKCRDHFIEAKRELRLLEMRKRRKEDEVAPADGKPRFSLSRLFGKKD
jgi:DnaJ-class molecular chaperone